VDLTIEAAISTTPVLPRDCTAALEYVPNPLAVSLGEAVATALTDAEAQKFIESLRGQLESGRCESRTAAVYLVATRPR